jgi:hypothetical protein
MRTLLYEAANVMLTRYGGQLKLKEWAFAIARRSTMRRRGLSSTQISVMALSLAALGGRRSDGLQFRAPSQKSTGIERCVDLV